MDGDGNRLGGDVPLDAFRARRCGQALGQREEVGVVGEGFLDESGNVEIRYFDVRVFLRDLSDIAAKRVDEWLMDRRDCVQQECYDRGVLGFWRDSDWVSPLSRTDNGEEARTCLEDHVHLHGIPKVIDTVLARSVEVELLQSVFEAVHFQTSFHLNL